MEEKNALPLENSGISPGRPVPEATGNGIFRRPFLRKIYAITCRGMDKDRTRIVLSGKGKPVERGGGVE